ncbi:MAG: TonB-dependent receptor plug domain-containing protein [bacterium]
MPRRIEPSDSVNIGYTTLLRRDVAGSVASIPGDLTTHGSSRTLLDMLDGRVPGVEVMRNSSGGAAVRVRGALREPLFVIDGIPKAGSLSEAISFLSARDIKSIEVLRSADLASAYGIRGANGVILIATKTARDQ